MHRSIALLVLALAAVGCGSSSGSPAPAPTSSVTLLGGMPIDPPPANGLQLILPVVHGVPGSSSEEWCTWDRVLDADIDVKSSKAFQTATGHHVVLFYTTVVQPVGTTRQCTNDDMATFRFANTGGEGSGEQDLPGDLVIHIPKGAQLVANHHYLNATDHAVDAQSAMNVRFADPGGTYERAGAVAVLDLGMVAHPGNSSFDINCAMNRDMDFWFVEPHMHQWGSHMLVELVGGEKLFDVDWNPDYVFHPPEIKRDLSDMFALHAGDQIHLRCTWDNTTTHDLTFGLEMCVLFGLTIDKAGIGNVACNAGAWQPF